MEKGGVYVQFSPLKEAFYTVQHAMRPKFEHEHVDRLRIVASYTSVIVRFIVEFMQFLPFIMLRDMFLQCDNWSSCAVNFVSLPLNALGALGKNGELSVLVIVMILVLTLGGFVFGTAIAVRKRDININNFRFLSVVFTLACCVYFTDIATLSIRNFFCHFSASEHYDDYSERCSETSFAAYAALGGITLAVLVPTAIVVGLLSPAFDFKRLSGRVSSVRTDVAIMLVKLVIVTCGLVIHSLEHRGWRGDEAVVEIRWDLRTAFQLVAFVLFATFTWYLLMQMPHTRDFDNRFRACTMGVLVGMTGVSAVHSIMMVASENATEDDGIAHFNYVFTIAGAMSGALISCIACSRKHALGRLFMRDMNLLSATDVSYGKDLLNILRTQTDEELDVLCGPTSLIDTAATTPPNSREIITPLNDARTPSQRPPQLNVNGSNPAFNSTLDNIMTPAQPTASPQASSNPWAMPAAPQAPLGVYNSQSPSRNTSRKPTSQNNSAFAIMPFNSQTSIAAAGAADAPAGSVTMGISRQKLSIYMNSPTFLEIHKSLNLSADMEIILRTLSEEWEDLIEPQREVARMTLLQLFAALYIKTQRGQDGTVPAGYFLWFAASAVTLFKDVEIASEALRIASESSRKMGFDEGFLCYMLQKACEDIRTSNVTSRRQTGVSDMAAFRRWTMSARTLHEKALNALKRFFKASLQNSTWKYITSQESDKYFNKTELKSISSAQRSLHDALSALNDAEEAYENLQQRYPAVPQVATMVTSFKRQFFREALSSGNKKTSKNAISFASVAEESSAYNNSHANTEDEDDIMRFTKVKSTTVASTEDSPDDDNELGEKNSYASMGSGLGETPKQLLMNNVSDSIMRSFNSARLWSFASLLVVVIIACAILVVAINEFGKVNDWLATYALISEVFSVIPESCMQGVRPIVGAEMLGTTFFTKVQNEIAENDILAPLLTRGRAPGTPDGRDLSLDADICFDIMQFAQGAMYCIVTYTNGESISVEYNSAGVPAVSAVSVMDGVDYWNLTSTDPNTKWYRDVHAFATAAGSPTPNSGYRFRNGYQILPPAEDIPANVTDYVDDIRFKYMSTPFYYAPDTATGSLADSPALQGMVTVLSKSTKNDIYSMYYARKLKAVISNLQAMANDFESRIRGLMVKDLMEMLQGDYFETIVYDEVGTALKKGYTFSEGVGFITSQMAEVRSNLVDAWDQEELKKMPSTRNFMEFCSSHNVINSEQALNLFRDHLEKTIDTSRLIVIVCAVCAIVTAVIAGGLTIKLVRTYLKEFDRADGVTPSLAIVATFPKSELRKIAKSLNSLKIDRGIFDPDDEHAAFMDLTVSRKTQKYQESLLRARAIATERDKELMDEFGAEDDGVVKFDQKDHIVMLPNGSRKSAANSQRSAAQGGFEFEAEESMGENYISTPASMRMGGKSASVAPSSVMGPMTVNDTDDMPVEEPLHGVFDLQQEIVNDDSSNKVKKSVRSQLDDEGSVLPASDHHIDSTSQQPKSKAQKIHDQVVQYEASESHASTKRSSLSNHSVVGVSGRVINAVVYRPISRSFFLVWFCMIGYVIFTIISSTNAIGRFKIFYNTVGHLIMVSFNSYITATFTTHIRRGTDNYAGYVSTDPEIFPQWALERAEGARKAYFTVIDRKSPFSWQTFGRFSADRVAVVYQPNCLSMFSKNTPCDENRFSLHHYEGEEYMREGQLRAVVYWTDFTEKYVNKYRDLAVTPTFGAFDNEAWYLFDSLVYDIEFGLHWFRQDLLRVGAMRVKMDTGSQVDLLIGAIAVGVVAAILLEIIIRSRIKDLKDTVVLLRVLPTRMLEDYRVVQNVLTIKTEDEI